MSSSPLYDYQRDALKKLHSGCILCGGVGSGKSRTSLAWFYTQNGGAIGDTRLTRKMRHPKDLYIITTARKRDTFEWEDELGYFGMSSDPNKSSYNNKVVIDSWNNIKKYIDVKDAVFIFDEQRVVGNGTWVKSFLKITKLNVWILLSATPGDTWSDYIPVFLANRFYRNRTDFTQQHIIYSRFTKFPKVDHYINTGKLMHLRNSILIKMDFARKTKAHHYDIFCEWDVTQYKQIGKIRWNPYKDQPIANIAELCYLWRRVVNSDPSRIVALMDILDAHDKVIVFYNFDYELEMIKEAMKNVSKTSVAEWNGHLHDPIPTRSSHWVYLVQYTAGCEGWNCIETDTTVFFSQNYSYKVMHQASGRIDRVNTPFVDLYYYHLRSRAPIDLAITKALKEKKTFNEKEFVK